MSLFAVALAAVLVVINRSPGDISHPPLTHGEAVAAIQRAGGIGNIRSDAERMFHLYKHNSLGAMTRNEAAKFPSLQSLGKLLGVWPGTPGFPEHIRIRRGGHNYPQFIYILNTNSTGSFLEHSCLEIAPAIFITEKR